jgi:hypothetical protein
MSNHGGNEEDDDSGSGARATQQRERARTLESRSRAWVEKPVRVEVVAAVTLALVRVRGCAPGTKGGGAWVDGAGGVG